MFLYLVRHGQSLGQAGANIPDPLLSDLGIEQARRAGAYLADGVQVSPSLHAPAPEIVMCSPIRRALHTAHILADAVGRHPVYVRHDLHEHGGPRPDCLVRNTIHSEYPGVELDPDMPDGPWWPLDEESEEDCFVRGQRAARWLRERFASQEGGVAVVTHSTSGHMFMCALLGHTSIASVGYAQNNTGISIFDVTDDYTRTWCTNSTVHLERSQIS